MCAQKKKDKKKKKDKDKKKKKDKDKEMRNLNDQCGSRGFIRVAEKFQKQDEFRLAIMQSMFRGPCC